jgi:P-type Na+/K+ transporter
VNLTGFSFHGLSANEAKHRLERDGPNIVNSSGGASLWTILLRQISNSLTMVGNVFQIAARWMVNARS